MTQANPNDETGTQAKTPRRDPVTGRPVEDDAVTPATEDTDGNDETPRRSGRSGR